MWHSQATSFEIKTVNNFMFLCTLCYFKAASGFFRVWIMNSLVNIMNSITGLSDSIKELKLYFINKMELKKNPKYNYLSLAISCKYFSCVK